MSQFQMVPVGDGGIAVSEQMKKDAQAAAGSIDAGGGLPRLYLCQPTGEIVNSGAAASKEYVVSAGDDNVTNLGTSPVFIMLTAQTRYRHSVHDDAEDREQVVWDAPKGTLTAAQDEDVATKRAKRYTRFVLMHVTPDGLDPHRLGPIGYDAKGMSTLAGMKWADAVAAQVLKGVPPFVLAWKLGSKLEESVKGRGSWNVLTHDAPMQLSLDPATYAMLRDTWAGLDARRKAEEGAPVRQSDGPTHADRIAQANADRAAQADREAVNAVRDTFGDASTRRVEKTDYATSLPDDEEVKPAETFEYQTPPANGEPMLMDSELKLGFHWGSAFRTGADKPAVAVRDMTKSEVEAAIEYADSMPVSNTVARSASKMLTRWLAHLSGPLYGSNDGTAAPPFFD